MPSNDFVSWLNTIGRRSNGVLTGGFGFLNYFGIASNSVNSSLPTPRTGQLVARFEF